MKIQKIILVLLCSISTTTFAQTITPDNRIVVLGEATLEIPADKVEFNIKLEYSDSADIQKVYKSHKEKESQLVKFLKELNIPNKNITYSLTNIGKRIDFHAENREERKIVYATNQTVSVTIDDVNKYVDFMMKLIGAGFTEISTSFKSSKENDFHDLLIEKAITIARKKATSIAKQSKREITKILKVSDTEESDSAFGYYGNTAAVAFSAPDVQETSIITEIPQTITKNLSLKVTFGLK